jgi:5-methyltetrahydropteroyltriglutamate--homocysteine methyltransferase
MTKTTDTIVLPTTITGSLPRPAWYTENLGRRAFRDAIADARFREQYTDAVGTFIRDQERAGLDIVTDGDARFDSDVGGMSWFQYPARRLQGLGGGDYARTKKGYGGTRKGDIIFEVMESRVMPRASGKIGRGTALHVSLESRAGADGQAREVRNDRAGLDRHVHWQRLLSETGRLAVCARRRDARGSTNWRALAARSSRWRSRTSTSPAFSGAEDRCSSGVLRRHVQPRREGPPRQDEVWCHTCWESGAAAAVCDESVVREALPLLDKLDVDVMTFETCANDGLDLEAIGKTITGKKGSRSSSITATCRSRRPIRWQRSFARPSMDSQGAAGRVTSDCGFGREGMSRRIAFYKMVAIVRGTNIVRKELGLPEAICLAADPRYALADEY